MNKKLYLLKIRLLDIEPEIWRHFAVPNNITLDRLHDVIQIVMGWTDSHLHDFIIENKRYTEEPEFEDDGFFEGEFKLCDLVKQKDSIFYYTYDFGDDWRHEIILVNNNYRNPKLQSQIECIKGKRACPPEDVGSVPGYYDFCDAFNDKKHEEHESYKGWYSSFPWYDDVFDSEKFDIEKVNYELLKYARWARVRHLAQYVY
jgi:hypothetical protein